MAQAEQVAADLTEEQLRLNHAAGVLYEKVKRHCTGREMSRQTVQAVEQIIYDHRQHARNAGVDFPQMVVLPFVRIKHIEVVRKDLIDNDRDVAVKLLNLVETLKDYGVKADDIAAACQYAWPGWKGLSSIARLNAATLMSAPQAVQ